ncbi:MAG: adenylate/guanylate cyclase domain-containing protein [Saprospiraceae bacterium]|nr:adenylate/guanylate cyclase domain-containing protein [Saprospiraceae bacterium]
MDTNRVRKLKQGRTIVLTGIFLGLFYIIFSDGFGEVYPFINGGVAGMLAGLVVAILELGVFAGALRKKRFINLLILRTTLYFVLLTFLILQVLIISRMIRLEQSYTEVLFDPAFQHYVFKEDFPIVVVYTMVLAFSINFVRMISRKMGQGMLLSYLTGTYRRPVDQERIVMFMKLKNSQGISEQLGSLDFYRFLNDFFYDITESIIVHKGIIYEYVEDLIVVTWSVDQGCTHSNCVRTFFHAIEELEFRKESFFAKYNIIPIPFAAFHYGHVIRSEIGDVKSEIVFHGDVMNTTARILEKCSGLKADLLISTQLANKLDLPKIYQSISRGKVKLKGKEESLELNEIIEILQTKV